MVVVAELFKEKKWLEIQLCVCMCVYLPQIHNLIFFLRSCFNLGTYASMHAHTHTLYLDRF